MRERVSFFSPSTSHVSWGVVYYSAWPSLFNSYPALRVATFITGGGAALTPAIPFLPHPTLVDIDVHAPCQDATHTGHNPSSCCG